MQELKVKLLQNLKVDGFIWAKGLEIRLPANKAKMLLRMGVAEQATAVAKQQEQQAT